MSTVMCEDTFVGPVGIPEKTHLILREPEIDLDDFARRIACRGRQALALLVESWDYALQFSRAVADFPVEARELKEAGLTGNDLRGLLYLGLVEQVAGPDARYATGSNGHSRRTAALPETACFTLTRAGLTFAQGVLAEVSASQGAPPPCDTSAGSETTALVPRWDAQRQMLYLGTTLVKRFKIPALNQVRILSAFEEEQWPARIDDPLSMTPGIDPKRRLHDTINALNRKQSDALIRFMGDGTGTGIRWELRGPAGGYRFTAQR
jgi:hypothetical protein